MSVDSTRREETESSVLIPPFFFSIPFQSCKVAQQLRSILWFDTHYPENTTFRSDSLNTQFLMLLRKIVNLIAHRLRYET